METHMEHTMEHKQFRILIITDDSHTMRTVTRILRDDGYKMSFAQDGIRALKKALAKDFDLILLDIVIPGMGGLEICKAFKQSPKTVDIPVIFLTMKDPMEDIVKGFEAGAVDCVTKPFTSAELRARVHAYVQLKHMRDTQEHLVSRLQSALEEQVRLEEALKARSQQFQTLVEEMPVCIFTHEGTRFRYLNPACEKITGYSRDELLSMDIIDIVHPEFKEGIRAYLEQRRKGRSTPKHLDFKIITKTGGERWLERQSLDINLDGKPQTLLIINDTTARKRLEIALQKGYDELEKLVEERTLDLHKTNRDLRKEIERRQHVEMQLKDGKRKLELKSRKFGELNAALKVLLQQREDDRAELEEQVLSNVNHLLNPHLEALKKRRLDPKSKMHLDILASNLHSITSSFSHKLSSKLINLTPTEIKVASLVKEGKMTRDIAQFLGSSLSAVNIHRFNIRRKLGLIGKDTNLQSFLLSLS